MANNYIVVPIHIEGKYLESDRMVASPLADFTKLPWNDGTKDINFDNPFVADGIVHQPFGSQNLLLKSGVHLHFILPHYLGQQIPQNAGLSNSGIIPAAPNRWLITRSTDNTQWLVESDYVHDVSYDPFDPNKNDELTCIIPFNTGQPYRYMGRKTLLTDNRPAGNTFKSLNNGNPLTVTGYGDINFSSFYPNCMGVFGFFDDSETPSPGLKYSVLGWNADAEDDVLSNAIAAIFNKNSNATGDQVNTQLKNLFKLEIDLNSNAINSSPVLRTIFYGEITIDIPPAHNPGSNLKIAIGNTGTEALSALVADQLSRANNNAALKPIIEDQLESILLFSKLDHLLVDTGPKFLEARHEKGFRSSHSGHIWRIVSQTSGNSPSSANTDAPAFPELPSDLAGLLHQLNLAQFAYDKSNHEVNSLKEQLYLDWNKYMHAAYPPLEGRGQYPDPDHIRYFIGTYSFAELNSLIALTGHIKYGDAQSGFQPAATTTSSTDLANQLCNAWNAANNLLTTENTSRTTNNQPLLSLSMIAGPRYWEPNAPAIMISGLPCENDDIVTPGNNYMNGKLYSSTQTLDLSSISTQNTGDILTQCSGTNSYKLSEQLWKPFILDWEVDLVDTNFLSTNGAFAPAAVQNNFKLDQFGPDFTTDSYQTGNLSVFSGSVIMSTHARQALLLNLKSFIAVALKKTGVVFTAANPMDNFLPSSTLTSWEAAIKNLPAPASATPDYTTITTVTDYSKNPVYAAWAAYQQLLGSNVISQTLNGFNQASIMRRKSAQLPIAEPLGFEDAQSFTASVKALVQTYYNPSKDTSGSVAVNVPQSSRDTSPITAFDFNPVRSGQFKLNRLRLTDDFGISHDIDMNSITTVAAETLLDAGGNIFLRPRLAQPGRLNFRWLSAVPVSDSENYYEDTTNTAETNDHPDTSPICGWLMANYIDNFISVYAADGIAIGYIDSNAEWKVLPWMNMVANVNANIQNPYLLNAVLWIMNTFQSSANEIKISDFLTATQTALNNVAPANAHLYDTKAILMGRPMAVVRSRVSFQTKGLPVLEQSWPALLADLNNCDANAPYTYANRYNKGWTEVQLPVRLGEHHQLNDGLIGYWPEDSYGNLNAEFIAPETSSDDVTDAQIDTFSNTNFQTRWLALNDPLNVTMLVDPRGLVHATTGMVPVKAISIPPQHYLSALKKINMWFYTSPVLQPVLNKTNKLFANLPAVENYTWQWWDSFNGVLPVNADNPKSNLHSKFQLMDGWMALSPQGNDLNIEIKQSNFEAAATNSLNFFISPSGPQAVAAGYATQTVLPGLQTEDENNNIPNCIQWMGNIVNRLSDGGGVQGELFWGETGNSPAYALNINQPFTVEAWNTCYQNAFSRAGSMGTISENLAGVTLSGPLTTILTTSPVSDNRFNSGNPWSDNDFATYVTENFTWLCNNLLTYTMYGVSYFQYYTDGTGANFIVPCKALYDYFYVMYQGSKALSFMINVSNNFIPKTWTDSFNAANQLLPQPNYLLTSAAGIASNYNIQNPWADSIFTNYVSQNFSALCSKIPSANLVNFKGNNYIVPCQSLYDYFWASYQNSITGN